MRTDVAAKDHTEDDDCSNTTATRTGSPLKFILLVFALSVPFWLIGAVTGVQFLPGDGGDDSRAHGDRTRGRNRPLEESLRLSADHREDLVRPYRTLDARRD